jgi:capsid protein
MIDGAMWDPILVSAGPPADPAAGRGRLGYDATESTPRRRTPYQILRSEDEELPAGKRQTLLATTRDLRRNFAIAAWAIRKHLDYTATFSFQARTGYAGLDRRIEDLMKWWSDPPRCDAAARHPLRRLIRLVESLRVIDGDALLVKLADGRLQLIEGDRIRTPNVTYDPPAGSATTHGIVTDPAGAALAYAIHTRTTSGGFVYERLISADNAFFHAHYDRADQIRGISPLAAALNTFRDVYEGIEYALAKAKLMQIFGIKFNRQAGDAFPASANGTDTDTGYSVDFGRGPFILDLDPGDDASFLEAAHPSEQFQHFMATTIALALKSLDLPLCFYDESVTNYSGQRQAILQYEQSATQKRADLQFILDQITGWKLATWIAAGLLQLPPPMTLADVRWEWIGAGMPWIDPQKETAADIAAIKNGLTSRTRILKAQGIEIADVLAELAAETAAIDAAGLEVEKPNNNQPAPPADTPPAA